MSVRKRRFLRGGRFSAWRRERWRTLRVIGSLCWATTGGIPLSAGWRIIAGSLDIRDYLEVDGYEIREPSREELREEGMNWFLPEGLFPMEGRKVLLLKFRARRPGYYLNESMVRFVVSQLQLEIGEYRCEGMMV